MKTRTKDDIVEYLRIRGEASPKELIDHFEISSQAMAIHLRDLLKQKAIFRVGSPPKVLYMISRAKGSKKDIDRDPIEVFKNNVSRVMGFASIPILGMADCGEAKQVAEQKQEGYLKISRNLLPRGTKIFAIKATGNSMNRAKVNGWKTIEEGDFVLIDGGVHAPQNGDYVLSVVDGAANLKKFYLDEKNKQIMLKSESSNFHPPIFLRPDECEYFVNGKVVDVIKKIKESD